MQHVTPLTTPPANVSRAVMGHAPSTAITTETTQGVISPVAIVTPKLTPTVQAEVPRRSGMGLARTERAATRARGSRGSRGSRGTARGPGRANIPPTQTTLSTPSSSCRPTGTGPNESGRRSEAQGSGGGRRGQRSQAGDRPSQAAATPAATGRAPPKRQLTLTHPNPLSPTPPGPLIAQWRISSFTGVSIYTEDSPGCHPTVGKKVHPPMAVIQVDKLSTA